MHGKPIPEGSPPSTSSRTIVDFREPESFTGGLLAPAPTVLARCAQSCGGFFASDYLKMGAAPVTWLGAALVITGGPLALVGWSLFTGGIGTCAVSTVASAVQTYMKKEDSTKKDVAYDIERSIAVSVLGPLFLFCGEGCPKTPEPYDE